LSNDALNLGKKRIFNHAALRQAGNKVQTKDNPIPK
jgi:hypothetical protein